MLEAYFSTTFAVFQPAALDTMGSQIVKHASTEKNKFCYYLCQHMLLLPVRLSLPSLKLLFVRDSLIIWKKKKANSHRTQLVAVAMQTKLSSCFIPNTMVFSQFFAIWRDMRVKFRVKGIELSNSYKPLYIASLS